MSADDLLLQDEIDALLHSVSGEEADESNRGNDPKSRIRAYDPSTQHRIIRDRLHALEIINERFARQFRIGLFNLIRRNADITVEPVRFQSYSIFSRNLPVPTNINLITMKPLQGTALVVFPPSMVFMVVDNLFGGDGRFLTKSEGREFTTTEQRIILRLLELATDTYEESWKSIYPLQISYVRSEMQVKFANITSSPNEIIAITNFHLEVGNLSSDFQICIPYTMIEPLRDMLTNPAIDSPSKADRSWSRRIAGEIRQTEIDLVADFVEIRSRMAQVQALKVGDVLPFELPDSVIARVDGVPVLECSFGSRNDRLALRVSRVIEHSTEQTGASAVHELMAKGQDSQKKGERPGEPSTPVSKPAPIRTPVKPETPAPASQQTKGT
ncbi:MAG: flagellar motor switch protein FliM [Pseudomonadales bacterium]|nr:flagellar motor switch protein FliM [Pseudomonadales bacterium]